MKKLSLLLLIVTTLFLPNCTKDKIETETEPELPVISVVDVSQKSDWDYWVVGKEDYYFVKANNDIPETVVYHSGETGYNYSVFFTNEGLIDKVMVDGYTFVFRNFNGTVLDLGIIDPKGDIKILREVETEYNWDEQVLTDKSISVKSQNMANEWSTVVKWTGRVVSGIPCALSVVAAGGTAGILTPAVGIACGTFAVALGADIAADEFEQEGVLTTVIGLGDKGLTIFACGAKQWGDCAAGVINVASDVMSGSLKESELEEAELRSLIASLETGFGDVQVNLTWDNETDLDLHVIDPNGYEVYYDNSSSSYGMTLDVDDTDGFGPENIFWSMQAPSPPGVYEVLVNYFDGTSNSSNYRVVISAFDITKTFTGSIPRDQTIRIINLDPLYDWSNSNANPKVVSVSKSAKIKKKAN